MVEGLVDPSGAYCTASGGISPPVLTLALMHASGEGQELADDLAWRTSTVNATSPASTPRFPHTRMESLGTYAHVHVGKPRGSIFI